MPNKFLEAALEYREAGLHPIPLLPFSKKPALTSWKEYQDRMPTVEEITSWWTLMPLSNVAILMGHGNVAVDVDGPEGILALAAAGIDLEGAPRSKTSRGYHAFYSATDVGNAIGLFGPESHVDIRGNGGYVVAPPSIHESGHVYEWLAPITGPLPSLPPAIANALRSPSTRPATAGTDWVTEALGSTPEGARDVTCTRLAGWLLRLGATEGQTDAFLQTWALRCSPAFPSDQVTKCVTSIVKREGEHAGPPSSLAEAIDVTLAEINAPPESRRVISTGLEGLDEVLQGGFYPGNYVYMGARPSVGKTALALQIARERATTHGVLIVTRDSTRSDLVRRLIAQEGQIDASALRKGELDRIQRKLMDIAAAKLRALNMWITTEVNTPGALEKTLDAYQPGVLGLLILDYLQLFDTDDMMRDTRSKVEWVSKRLKAIGIKYDVPLLVLSSLSRPDRSNPGWRPSLDSLRDSGQLEHDADTVILLHRELGNSLLEVNVAKQKDGPTGSLTLQFNAKTLTTTEAS